MSEFKKVKMSELFPGIMSGNLRIMSGSSQVTWEDLSKSSLKELEYEVCDISEDPRGKVPGWKKFACRVAGSGDWYVSYLEPERHASVFGKGE